MLDMIGNKVVLPDGRTVTVYDDPKNWPKVGETGFVPEEAVLPDPEQPRTTAGILETEEHQQFTASIQKYGQGMIMKVRVLSKAELDAVKKEYPQARYMVVDGERRYHAIGKNGADLAVYEITVRSFKEKRGVFLQQVVDNTMQAPLNTPDLARALLKIQRDYGGINASELSGMVNMNQTLVNDCLHIANLPDDLIQLTNEDTYNRRRRPLSRKPAVALSRITGKDGVSSHDRQRKIWREAQDRKIQGAAALTAFFEQFHSEVVKSHGEKRRPKRMRNRLEQFIGMISGNDLLHATPEELRSMLTTASNDEVSILIEQARCACTDLSKLVENMQEAISNRISLNLGRIDGVANNVTVVTGDADTAAEVTVVPGATPTRSIVPPSENEQKPISADVELKPTPDVDLPDPDDDVTDLSGDVESDGMEELGFPSGDHDYRREKPPVVPTKPVLHSLPNPEPPTRKKRESVSSGNSSNGAWKPFYAQYWDESTGSWAGTSIETPRQYIRMFKAGLFKWQDEEEPKPKRFPTIEEANALDAAWRNSHK